MRSKAQSNSLVHIFQQGPHSQFDNGKGPLFFRFAPWDQKVGVAVAIFKDAEQVEIARFCRARSTVILNGESESNKRIVAEVPHAIVKDAIHDFFARNQSLITGVVFFNRVEYTIACWDKIIKIGHSDKEVRQGGEPRPSGGCL